MYTATVYYCGLWNPPCVWLTVDLNRVQQSCHSKCVCHSSCYECERRALSVSCLWIKKFGQSWALTLDFSLSRITGMKNCCLIWKVPAFQTSTNYTRISNISERGFCFYILCEEFRSYNGLHKGPGGKKKWKRQKLLCVYLLEIEDNSTSPLQ